MALTNCVECNGSVSDTALTCPHCGIAAPALNHAQKVEAVIAVKRAAYGSMGGWLFFAGIGWLVFAGSISKETLVDAWSLAKWLIMAGAGMYIIAEIERNLAERKTRRK